MKIQTFDFNVDLLRSLIWQYDTGDNLNITGLIKDKQNGSKYGYYSFVDDFSSKRRNE